MLSDRSQGDSDRDYTMEAAPDAASWLPMGEVFLNNQSTLFVDPLPPSDGARLYRARPSTLIE